MKYLKLSFKKADVTSTLLTVIAHYNTMTKASGVTPKLTFGLQPFLGVEIAFQHSLIQQHIPDRLRHDDIHPLWKGDLLDLPGQDRDPIGQMVALDKNLEVKIDDSFLGRVRRRMPQFSVKPFPCPDFHRHITLSVQFFPTRICNKNILNDSNYAQ